MSKGEGFWGSSCSWGIAVPSDPHLRTNVMLARFSRPDALQRGAGSGSTPAGPLRFVAGRSRPPRLRCNMGVCGAGGARPCPQECDLRSFHELSTT